MSATLAERLRQAEAKLAELEAKLAPPVQEPPPVEPRPRRQPHVGNPPPPAPLWRFTIAATPQPGGQPQRGTITVSPTDGRGQPVPTVFGSPRSTDPAGTETAIFVTDGDAVDAPLAEFLRGHGYSANLSPCDPPRDGRTPVAAPAFVRRWVTDQIAAGRLVLATAAAPLPPPDVRRQVREAAGLSRPQAAELVGVSREALRKWETGELEPAGENRQRYAELLSTWLDGAQQPAVPVRGEDPLEVQGMLREAEEAAAEAGRPLTAGERAAMRSAAFRRHKQRRSPASKPSWIPGDLVPRRRFDGAEQ